MLAAATGPTPFWYATRGSGYAALVLLTGSVVLGLLTSLRWHTPAWPRFLSQALHRNVSLITAVFLVIHIATSIIDPFARLSLRDAVIPAGAAYRPLWLGLGVIATELFVAVVATSLLRRRLSFRAWQAVHLLAYVSWPVAVLHGIGTGTDTKAPWALLLVVACVAATGTALVWRLADGWPGQAALRAGGIAMSLAGVIAIAAWTAGGPLQPGWARAAGTPSDLLGSGSGTAAVAVPSLRAGLDDPLTGSVTGDRNQVTATLADQNDSTLTLVIVANQDGTGTIRVTRSGVALCNVVATIGNTVSARCAGVQLSIQLSQQASGVATGTLITSVPAG